MRHLCLLIRTCALPSEVATNCTNLRNSGTSAFTCQFESFVAVFRLHCTVHEHLEQFRPWRPWAIGAFSRIHGRWQQETTPQVDRNDVSRLMLSVRHVSGHYSFQTSLRRSGIQVPSGRLSTSIPALNNAAHTQLRLPTELAPTLAIAPHPATYRWAITASNLKSAADPALRTPPSTSAA